MAVESFDPVWGDLTGHRYVGVLAVVDGAGTFSEMRLLDGAGENVPLPRAAGAVTRGVDPIRTLLNLDTGTNAGIILDVQSVGDAVPGQTASVLFAGRFGASGHISGTFRATRRAP